MNQPPYIDNLHAPDVYASFASGVAAEAGNLKITLASQRSSHNQEGAQANVVIGRLVMPIGAAIELAHLIQTFAASLQAEATNKPGIQ